VIYDVAQNILSFLKANCTKEGHTYWLFKGSGEHIVGIKMYRIVACCDFLIIVVKFWPVANAIFI